MFRLPIPVLLACLLSVMLVMHGGCDNDAATKGIRTKVVFSDAYSANDTWLVYWYLCGTDLESTGGAATLDLEELLAADLPENVRVIIQTGGTEEWQNDTVPDNKIGRYLVDKDGLHEIAVLPDADMGSVDTLTDFLRFGRDNYAADHRVFVFWDHGGGSANGVCQDERTGNVLSLNDIRQAFAAIHPASAASPPFELIGFDACLMATYDVAASLDGLTRYLVGSEELEPGNGWGYTGWVQALADNPAMGGAGLGQAICDSYMDSCEEYDTDAEATLSVIDMAKLPTLKAAYEAFSADALRHAEKNPQAFFSSFGREAHQAENYGGNTRERGFSNMVDLGDLARKTGALLPNTSPRLLAAIDDAVIYKVQGSYRDKGCGISGYYSYDGDTDNFDSYAAVAAAPLASKCLYYFLIYGEMPEEARPILAGEAPAPTTGEAPAAPLTLHNIGSAVAQKLFDVSSLEDLAVTVSDDGEAIIKLTEAQMDMLAGVHCDLIFSDEEDDIMLYLGTDADINADWDTGVFKDNFRGVWPMLDGHPVYIEITAEEDDYNLYSVPIKLNGVPCNLQVAYNFKDEAYQILGARKGLGSSGMGDRNLIKLKKGDVVTTIHYAMTISGNDEEFQPVDVDTFTIGSDPKFADEEIGDGEYGYCFRFVTPTGDSAFSQMVWFTIKGEEIFTSVYDE